MLKLNLWSSVCVTESACMYDPENPILMPSRQLASFPRFHDDFTVQSDAFEILIWMPVILPPSPFLNTFCKSPYGSPNTFLFSQVTYSSNPSQYLACLTSARFNLDGMLYYPITEMVEFAHIGLGYLLPTQQLINTSLMCPNPG